MTKKNPHILYVVFKVLSIRKRRELRREFGAQHHYGEAMPKLPPQL
ncbi:hypothetical protein AGR1C_Cc10007 [Agrobacterium fabacearum TT111]|nr:hypothetical protein AGR1C_Cc10007 [Agrobacterium fabacearum TT111]